METVLPPSRVSSKSDWTSTFCEQLNSSLQHVQKRETTLSPVRPTPKRPRHSPPPPPLPAVNPTKLATMSPVTRRMARLPVKPSGERRLAVRADAMEVTEEIAHKREMQRRQMLKDVDADEFNDFVAYLQRFSRRPQTFMKKTEDQDEAALLATSGEGVIAELRQKILLFAKKGAMRYVDPQLLASVISILEKRIFESSRTCCLNQNGGISKESTRDATLGILSAATVLAILSAPGSPRKLLVEEMLDEIASLLKNCASVIIFPLRDPLYREMKPTKRRKKKRKNQRQPGRADSDPEQNSQAAENPDPDNDNKKSAIPRRAFLKQDEVLLNYFCLTLDTMSSLLEKERHLPDSVVSTTASTCCQSLSVTGIARLQVHAMKAACAIFQSYPQHRMAMLDDLREAASRVPAARRHLRSFKLPEDQTAIRACSALLAQLLCSATVAAPVSRGTDAKGDGDGDTDLVLVKNHKSSHDNAANLAMYVLNPMLQRAYNDRDVEYRAAFQALFEDILVLYGRPEWPSAELMLQTLSVSIITKLRSKNEKSVFARITSIEVLGSLVAKMCELYGGDILREGRQNGADNGEALALEVSKEQLLLYLDPEKSRQLGAAYSFCEARFISDDYSVAINFEEKSKGMAEERKHRDEDDCDDVIDGQEVSAPEKGSLLARVASEAIDRRRNVSERRLRGEDITRLAASEAAIFIGKNRSFTAGVKTILETILDGMHDSAPTTRAKSIKALASIDASCHGIIRVVPGVLKFIEGSCRDVSTLARDAALDLLGRSLLMDRNAPTDPNGQAQLPQKNKDQSQMHSEVSLFPKIFSIVEKRLCDTATSVRKRAISILKTVLSHDLAASERFRREPMKAMESIQEMRQHEARIIQICTSLVLRLDDPENTVREAAERTLRLGLFGFDISQQIRSSEDHDAQEASKLATRFVTVYARLPNGIHVSFMSRVVHKALLIKNQKLLSAIVSAVVDEMHDCEAAMARILNGRELRTLPELDRSKIRPFSVRRVACAFVLFAFGGLDKSLIIPHIRSLAPTIKGVQELGTSENDLKCVQKILNVLEIGFSDSTDFEQSFLEEVMHDVELIVCTSPLPLLEEAAVKCFCVVSKKLLFNEENPLKSAADSFHGFLVNSMASLRTDCASSASQKPSGMERNARGALVRLGLLVRYGNFESEFVSSVYKTLEAVCETVTGKHQRDLLPRAVIRALAHVLIRHRSYLPNGTKILGEVWLKSTTAAAPGSLQTISMSEGIHFSILQGFHDLLRDEEERNFTGKDEKMSTSEKDRAESGQGQGKTPIGFHNPDVSRGQSDSALDAKPVLAAEEDAEAGFLALSAQTMMPSFKNAVNSPSVQVRRMIANILGLLVRQGLLLPATVVTELFTLLLDRDLRCREYAHRVVAFLANRHSGMLASAAVPALRTCFENSFIARTTRVGDLSTEQPKQLAYHQPGANRTEALDDRLVIPSRPVPTVQQVTSLTVDERTGQALLSQALMSMRREQRRGVFESMMREFDPRVVLVVESPTDNSNDTRVQEEDIEHKMRISNGETEVLSSNKMDSEEEDDDEVANVGCASMDLSAANPRCSLPTLYCLASTLASIDYTNGAGVGGSLGQGGGTAAADTKLKYAKEDVTELVGIATRIISNSGQAILQMAKKLRRSRSPNVEKKQRVAHYASRMSLLLALKHHLKIERWKPLLSNDDAREEAELSSSSCRMPSFVPTVTYLKAANWNPDAFPHVTEETADAQLDLFSKQMKDDAIEDADITTSNRKESRQARKRGSSRRASSKSANQGTVSIATPSPRRVVHPRRASTAKKLRYEGGDSGEDGSDFDPSMQD